jgi:superfamily II DNA or RNA helicase
MENYQFTYNYKIGLSDGRKYFYKVVDGKVLIPKGLSRGLSRDFNIPYEEIEDNIKFTKEELQDHIKSLNLPFEPYEYQFDGVLEMLNDKRMVGIYATGAGKSLIFYLFLTFLLKRGYKSILLVPNVGLVEQMYNDFKDYGMSDEISKNIAKIYSGQEKNVEAPLIISTWQSMIKLIKYPFIKTIDAIAVDEAHGLNDIENSIGKIVSVTENAKWKIGLTGTLPEAETGRLSLYSFLGSLNVRIRPIDLIKMGRATPVSVKMIYLNYDKNKAKQLISKMIAKKKYNKEIQFLESYLPRNEVIIKIANSVTQKYGNSILLFSSIVHGELLLKIAMKNKIPELKSIDYEDIEFKTKLSSKTKRTGEVIFYQSLAKNYIPKPNEYCINDYDIYFVKGEVKGEERHKISKILEEKKNALLIANFATTSTGTSIKNIHNIIFGITTKGFIRVSQSLGRGMRLHNSKNKVNIIDIVDDIDGKNYALQHSEKRLSNVYHFNGYPIDEKELQL